MQSSQLHAVARIDFKRRFLIDSNFANPNEKPEQTSAYASDQLRECEVGGNDFIPLKVSKIIII